MGETTAEIRFILIQFKTKKINETKYININPILKPKTCLIFESYTNEKRSPSNFYLILKIIKTSLSS